MHLHQVSILQSHMAYVDAGEGPAILFLHGNPTSSYVWRNIIPELTGSFRCVAPDLIGFGASAKPHIEYRFLDHVRYLDEFIDKVGLGPMFLVAHDWGTALAFHLAARYPKLVRGLAFMEFIRPFPDWNSFHQRAETRQLFQSFRTSGLGEKLVLEENVFVEQVLPRSVVRRLTPAEMDAYRTPFPDESSRKPILAFPRELPIAGEPPDTYQWLQRAHSALLLSTYPKLLFCGNPGALVSPEIAREYRDRLHSCELVQLPSGFHYLQEDHPDVIARELSSWLGRLCAGHEDKRPSASLVR